MKIFLSGGEKGSHRSLLLASGATRVAVNLTHLSLPKKKEFLLPSVIPNAEIALYTSESDEDVARFDEFIRAHSDHISLIVGRSDYDGSWLGNKYIPIWSDDKDLERLAWICQTYGRVAIPDKALTAKSIPRIKQLQQRWGVRLVGLTSKPDSIDALDWDTVIVSSWTSVIRYGETQVWDGHGLRRYSSQQKESSRKRHRPDIARLGVDADAVIDDNVQEVGKLAIKSWMAFEGGNMAYSPQGEGDEDEFSSSQSTEVVATPTNYPTGDNQSSGYPNIAIAAAKKRHEDDRVLLPVMGIESITSMGSRTSDEDGEAYEISPEQVSVLKYQGDPLRQCNSCYLASRCPAFQQDTECGFKLPIEIRTKDQLQAALRALLEMQVSRVLFARFAEELEGQGLDPNLSKEMDRMFALVEKFRNISDSRELVRMEIETRSSSGVLSRLFGAKAGDVSRQLPGGPISPDQFNSMALDIIDVEEP